MQLFFREALGVTMGGLGGSARDTGRAAWRRASLKLLQHIQHEPGSFSNLSLLCWRTKLVTMFLFDCSRAFDNP